MKDAELDVNLKSWISDTSFRTWFGISII